MKRKAMILSGPSGCGKSTFVRALQRKDGRIHPCCSTDDQMMLSGEYVFDPRRLPKAHSDNFNMFVEFARSSAQIVIVDNTNIHGWEHQNYRDVALAFNRDVEYHYWLVETEDEIQACIERNAHGVPEDTIRRMAKEHEIYKPKGDKRVSVVFHELALDGAEV